MLKNDIAITTEECTSFKILMNQRFRVNGMLKDINLACDNENETSNILKQ
jgi:hypothetical protein